jgi:nucleotide-binding universal stress UspA family protein
MGPTKNWLIATYGTKYAMSALRMAAYQCTVVSPQPQVTILVVATSPQSEQEATDIMEEAHQAFDDILLGKNDPNLEIRIGDPAEEILMAVREHEIDHLFMGAGDFKYDINSPGKGGVTNKVLNGYHGVMTLVK